MLANLFLNVSQNCTSKTIPTERDQGELTHHIYSGANLSETFAHYAGMIHSASSVGDKHYKWVAKPLTSSISLSTTMEKVCTVAADTTSYLE